MRHQFSRRTFLAASATTLAALLLPGPSARAARMHSVAHGPHPTPRVGITGAKVLAKAELANKPHLVALFDSVRVVPEVIDGIRCNCGCSHSDGFYSLLSCYEGRDAMARECAICQGQGRLAVRLHKAGKSLDEIRVAVDAKFG